MAMNKAPLLRGQTPAFAEGPGLPFADGMPSTTSVVVANTSNPFDSLLMVLAVLLVINHMGRPFEHVLVGFRLPAILCGIAAIVSVVSCISGLQATPGKALAAFVMWIAIVAPLSSWRSASILYVINFASFWLVFYMITACAPKSFKQMKWLYILTALSYVVNILVSGRFGEQGRFEMSGTYGNSGDAAILAGLAIPFWLFLSGRFPMFLRIILSLAGVTFLLRIIVMTATRSILISLFFMFMVWFLRTKVIYKIIGVILVAILGIALFTTAPQSIRDRLSTVVSALTGQTGVAEVDEAAGSTMERHSLLQDGITTTLRFPLWGVGSGQFAEYRWAALSTAGGRKGAQVTHNTYVQLSAENGIPGLLLYLLFLWTTYQCIGRARKATASQATPDLLLGSELVSVLEMALIFLVVTQLFYSMETAPHLFLLAGFAVASERLAKSEAMRAKLATKPVNAPSPIGPGPALRPAMPR